MIAAVYADAGDLDVALIQEVASAVQQTIEAAIANLTPAQQRKLHDRSGRHLICGLLVLIVQALEPVADADQQIAEALTHADRPQHLGLSEMITAKLLKGMISRLIRALAQTALAQAKVTLKLLRICAIATCPGPDHHPEITLHCIAPLAGEVVNTATVSQLAHVQLASIKELP